MVDPKYGVAASPRVIEEGQPVPKGGGVYRVGNAYTVAGRTYVPETDPNYRAEGIASWYGRDFHGRRTANGEIYDMDAISAAHPTLCDTMTGSAKFIASLTTRPHVSCSFEGSTKTSAAAYARGASRSA